MPAPDLRSSARLLHDVFGVAKFRDTSYLNWFYRRHPVGPAIEVDRFDADEPVGHLAGIVQEYQSGSRILPAVFPLNIAVSDQARGRGLMLEMSRACFEQAVLRFGNAVLVGMPNRASTPGYTTRLGFRLVGPLPVRLCPAIWPSFPRVESRPVDQSYLESSAFDELANSIDFSAGSGWSQRWTPDLLRWRLSAPGAEYTVHASGELVIVTTAVRSYGMPVSVVLKTFSRSSLRRQNANGIVAKACRFHKCIAAIYAGFSDACEIMGKELPERLKPSPLNLIVRSLVPGFLDEASFQFDRFEFFDFDAY